jgi:hypothetical protein
MTLAGDARDAANWAADPPEGGLASPLRLTAAVGVPLSLTAWVVDRLQPGAERDPVDGGVTWATHAGPAPAVFAQPRLQPETGADGQVVTTVTFHEPGAYVLRVRADNFNPVDSTPGDQCCWTNGYIAVDVSPP